MRFLFLKAVWNMAWKKFAAAFYVEACRELTEVLRGSTES